MLTNLTRHTSNTSRNSEASSTSRGGSSPGSAQAIAFVAMSTPPPPDLARKVSQLDNDVGAIYNMLNAIQTTQQRHGNRLEEIGQDLGGIRDDVIAMRGEMGALRDDITGICREIEAILVLLRGGGQPPT